MNRDGPSESRKPLLANLTWPTALTMLLFAGYVLSYAPAYRYRHGPDGSFSLFGPFRSVEQPMPSVYRPVEYLMDHTSMDRVLVKWAALWGVSREMRYDTNLRIGWRLEARH